MATVTIKDFNLLKTKVDNLESRLNVLDASVNYMNNRLLLIEKILNNIDDKHDAGGLQIKDLDYIGDIISNDIP